MRSEIPLMFALCASVFAHGRFVDVQEAWQLMGQGGVILDSRSPSAYRSGHLAGARNVLWDDFSDRSSPLAKGRLDLDTAALGRKLGALGVRRGKPVLVYGEVPGGWGEEGRIAWMLETLGHQDVHVLDGGIRAWQAAGGTLTTEVPAPATGTFDVVPVAGTSATADEVRAAGKGAILLDTRTPEEYRGATWYGAPRGGHIPGARLLPWKELLDASGKLRPAEKIRELVSGHPSQPVTGPVIAYCTGGVRSGFMYWALRHAGIPGARNFAGSWWEWSARTDLPVETE